MDLISPAYGSLSYCSDHYSHHVMNTRSVPRQVEQATCVDQVNITERKLAPYAAIKLKKYSIGPKQPEFAYSSSTKLRQQRRCRLKRVVN